MSVVLGIVGLLGIAASGYLAFASAGGGGLAVAIMLPASLIGILLAVALLGLSELLRVAYFVEWTLKRMNRNTPA